jgi:formate/nitrite transporter FocA (FNT family)
LGNWFRKWAAFVGFALLGPTFLAYSITSFLHGELPSRHGSAITSASSPYLFYPLALALICGSALMTYLSVMFVIGYVRGRSHREK